MVLLFLLTSLGHSNSTINDGQCVVCLIRDNVDEEVRLSIQLAFVSQALKPDLVQSLNMVKEN